MAVHCAQGNAFCSTAKADRGNQTIPSPTAVADVLPDEPGGYSGFQALFGHRYVAPQLGAGTPSLTRNGFQVTNAAGNLVGRAIEPTPANCDGVTVACTYPAGSFGELDGNLTGLLATQKNDTTPFTLENDTAPEFYVTGDPAANAPQVRTLERDVAGLTADNPYAGGTQKIANYIADPTEEAILHMVNADPARTPTFALFAKPDYYLTTGSATCTGSCVTVNSGFAWDHGDYAAEINTNYAAFAGPGVKHLGLDGQAPGTGPSSAGANSGQTVVVNSGTTGTWMDETDIRPTLMYLTGLKDDYEHDGRVVTQILADPNHALNGPGVASLGACYKQLNSSVGQFGNATLQAATAAAESSTANDLEFRQVNIALSGLERARDALALRIKGELEAAAFGDQPVLGATGQVIACQVIIGAAKVLAQHV